MQRGQSGNVSALPNVISFVMEERNAAMPQFEQVKKGFARVRILPKDATRAYLLLMRHSNGRVKVLPNDLYELDEAQVQALTESGVEFERVDGKAGEQTT
jgi:hypothetical protein